MNIIEATKASAETGCIIHRPSGLNSDNALLQRAEYLAVDENGILVEISTRYPVMISSRAILADDWEIVQ